MDPVVARPRQETIKLIEHGTHAYELVRIGKGYMLFHKSERGTASVMLLPEVLKELGAAMMTEGG